MAGSPFAPVRTLAAVAACGALFAAGWIAASSRVPEPAPTFRTAVDPPPLLLPSLLTVAPGVHLLGYTFPNAAYVVETTDGLVLVDTCKEDDARPILRQLNALGLRPDQLRRILLTHSHGDHSLGARELRRMTGAKIYAGAGDCAALRSGEPREAFFSAFDMPQAIHPTEVDVELSGGEVIEQGGARFRVLATPGHTPGSVCYLLERDGLRILFTGDTVMSLTDAATLTGPGTYTAYLSPRYGGSARDCLATLRMLRAMPAPDSVLPGHPGSDPEPQNARVAPERWKALLTRAIGDMEVLLARYEKDGADFLDGRPKEVLPGLHYFGDCAGRAVYGLVTPSRRLFVFNAPGGAALPGFLQARLQEAGLGAVHPFAVLLTSCGPESTKGLRELVESTGCAVVVPDEGVEDLRERLPAGTEIHPAGWLPSAGWFPVEVLPILGRAAAGTAYALRWEGRTVLLTGRNPTRITAENEGDALRSRPMAREDAKRYMESIDRLASRTPDLWLPAVSVRDQNANLYDDDWERAMRTNRELFQ